MLAAVPYRVSLEDLFDGPFDLLLFLVRKHEIDVQSVSLSRIVHDFQEYLEVLEILDFDLAADFVVTASTLAEIKSQMALVRNEPEEEEPAEELSDAAPGNFVEHLLAYKRLKEAAETLQEQALAWHDRYPRLTDERPNARRSSADDFIKDVEVWDLVGAFARIVRKKSDDSEHKLKFDETPIHVYVDRIGKIIREQGRVLFQSLFEEDADRSQVIGMFLAVLELVRHHGYLAEQVDDFNEIWLMPPNGEDDDRLPTSLGSNSEASESEPPASEGEPSEPESEPPAAE